MAYTNWQIIKIADLEEYGGYPEQRQPNYKLLVAVDDGDGIKKFDSSLIRIKFTDGGIMIDDKFNELDAKIGAIMGSFEIASIDAETGEPDVDEPSTKVIYLTRDVDSGETDPYTEWIYIEGSGWSIIGETTIDLSNYMHKVAEATTGNFAVLTAAGEVSDSRLNSSYFATAAQGIKADTAYQLPTNGIPETDLESSVQTSLGLADTAYQLPANGIPSTDLESSVQTSLGLADTAVQSGDLATVATTGSYNDLSNKPTIPSAQVNSDWNASSGVAEILNKPTLATVATTGEYGDLSNAPNLATVATSGDYDDLTNKPNIPAAQVNSDWNAASGVAVILNKPTLATVATSGDYEDLSNAPTLATVATTGDYEDLANKPTIPAAQVNSDWNSNSGVSEILNKPHIPVIETVEIS